MMMSSYGQGKAPKGSDIDILFLTFFLLLLVCIKSFLVFCVSTPLHSSSLMSSCRRIFYFEQHSERDRREKFVFSFRFNRVQRG